jgi:hypothetical protein
MPPICRVPMIALDFLSPDRLFTGRFGESMVMTMSTVEFDRIGCAPAGRISPPAAIAAAMLRRGFIGKALRYGAGASIAMLLLVTALVLRFAHMLWTMPGALLG